MIYHRAGCVRLNCCCLSVCLPTFGSTTASVERKTPTMHTCLAYPPTRELDQSCAVGAVTAESDDDGAVIHLVFHAKRATGSLVTL